MRTTTLRWGALGVLLSACSLGSVGEENHAGAADAGAAGAGGSSGTGGSANTGGGETGGAAGAGGSAGASGGAAGTGGSAGAPGGAAGAGGSAGASGGAAGAGGSAGASGGAAGTGGDAGVVVTSTISATAVSSSAIQVTVKLNKAAPCLVQFRPQGTSTWSDKLPSENSSIHGVNPPHVQTVSGLSPGAWEVRALDHLAGSYTTKTLVVNLSNVVGGLSKQGLTFTTIPSGVAYGAWSTQRWTTMFGNVAPNYGGGMGQVKTQVLDGTLAIIHRVTPTAPPGTSPALPKNGSDRVDGAWNLPAQPQKRFALMQSVRLPNDFAAGWKEQSGKLGWGLGGGSVPSGGKPLKDGFSARLSFRGNKAQPDTSSVVYPILYVYSADWPGQYGEDVHFVDPATTKDFELKRGTWVEFAWEVVMNSAPGKSDGSLRGWVNGVLMIERKNKQWFSQLASGDAAPHVDRIILSTFHGGATSDWAPSHANEIAFSGLHFGVPNPPW